MTIDEAIRELKQFSGTTRLRLSANFWEALNTAIKALEQEPCKDAISRKAVLNTLDFTDKFLDETRTVESYKTLLEECYKNLPPVIPTHKKGKWENLDSYHYYNDGEIETAELRCSCCNEIVEWDIESPHKPYYCENCGAEMESADDGND